MSELDVMKAMLNRIGTGYGLRDDHNPDGTAVLIETGPDESDFYVTQFWFDSEGVLQEVMGGKGEVF